MYDEIPAAAESRRAELIGPAGTEARRTDMAVA
ncbi:hypothetical protein HNR04_001909 [Corynebacterium durum]|nr:hypothetical protein [Corynebacterium durum]